MSDKVIDPDLGKRDILESEIPRDVLDILLKDRTTGKNILWMTDGYEHLESIFGIKMGIHDPIDADAISRPYAVPHEAMGVRRVMANARAESDLKPKKKSASRKTSKGGR